VEIIEKQTLFKPFDNDAAKLKIIDLRGLLSACLQRNFKIIGWTILQHV